MVRATAAGEVPAVIEKRQRKYFVVVVKRAEAVECFPYCLHWLLPGVVCWSRREETATLAPCLGALQFNPIYPLQFRYSHPRLSQFTFSQPHWPPNLPTDRHAHHCCNYVFFNHLPDQYALTEALCGAYCH